MIISVREKNSLSLLEKKIINQHLNQGGMLAFPTDTVYGLGVKIDFPQSVDLIYQIKNRTDTKPLILMGNNIEQFRPYTSQPKLLDHPLLSVCWPGPLTVLLPFKKETGLHYSLEETDLIGFRVPKHPLLLDLLSFLSFPLLTTSANQSGYNPIQDGKSIQSWLLSSSLQNFLVLEEGILNKPPSTVISMVSEKEYHIIRHGEITDDIISSYFTS